jgi:hypothetical protein
VLEWLLKELLVLAPFFLAHTKAQLVSACWFESNEAARQPGDINWLLVPGPCAWPTHGLR